MAYLPLEQKTSATLVVAVVAGLLWQVGAGPGLLAQDMPEDDLYLMDLGIVIEPGGEDAPGPGAALPSSDDLMLMVGKGPAGAAYVESTRELRSLLDDLSLKIITLENSLDQDLNAVRLENDRLRALIKKIQSNRRSAESLPGKEILADRVDVPTKPAALPESPSYRHVFRAYRAGLYPEVIALCPYVAAASMSRNEAVQLAYWWADASFRTGQFDEALTVLHQTAVIDHELQDDAIILEGLILLKQGKPQAALAQFETIIQQYPTSDYHRMAELTAKELTH